MTDEELNNVGRGVLLSLSKVCPTPGDALSVLVYVLLCLYEHKPKGSTQTFTEFANGFRDHAIATYDANVQGNAPTTHEVQ
jgi:hypothetical protein